MVSTQCRAAPSPLKPICTYVHLCVGCHTEGNASATTIFEIFPYNAVKINRALLEQEMSNLYNLYKNYSNLYCCSS